MTDRTIRILRIAFGLLPLVALGRQLSVHRELGFGLINFFSYFTNLSNLLAAFVLLYAAAFASRGSPDTVLETWRAVSVISMALVGILFSLLLRNTDLGSLLPWVNFVHHYLMPCIVVLDWVLVPPAVALGVRQLLLCMIYPLVYVTYALARGGGTGWYPYPFLDPHRVGGTGVAAYVVGITAAFVVFGAGLIALGNRLRMRAAVRIERALA